jgi:hypothetical protein
VWGVPWVGRGWAGSVQGFEVVEIVEELLLDGGDGQGVAGGDFGGGVGFVDGALGLDGEEVTVALGLGVTLGDGLGDAVGARLDGLGTGGGVGKEEVGTRVGALGGT